MTAVVEGSNETRAMSLVTQRLVERFPHVTRQDIDATVAEAHHRYDSSRVRDFVPILVEREVVEKLRARSQVSTTV